MKKVATRNYLLSKPETVEDFPFGPEVAVFKVKGKMFATLSLGTGNEKGMNVKMAGYWNINLKCPPDQAEMLRSIFTAIVPAYHMNKKHWNTLILDGSIPSQEIKRQINVSYSLVVKSLKKSERNLLELCYPLTDLYL